eukprot:CAMPEP_0177454508 /NCGR_PEP_ID=MMETSP0369-20130122/11414_1 /TAXON_ID=447022 ORGANISM="Scrippsiella hangoei-like, Strain SHHI-4" /NCGR_SAMPLE_ID=MMETSP0369 /ASSEMBLY_ACC=CAM_ASM_000364 /LENGTH=72 /DNA_ID=CAMNT_0018927323 /DNA_START=52 /DNA_END=270 /DNA_ORIENTATION=-
MTGELGVCTDKTAHLWIRELSQALDDFVLVLAAALADPFCRPSKHLSCGITDSIRPSNIRAFASDIVASKRM